MEPIIEFKDISLIYDKGKPNEARALSHISLEIEKGEYAAFFGPSGCGKTTLLYILMGIIPMPEDGTLFIHNESTRSFTKEHYALLRQTKMGIIFQNFNLIPNLSTFENVALPLVFQGVPEKERKIQVQKLLTRFELIRYASYFPQELSGGMQQRVAIARSLVHNPEIILADEPVGNLDTKNAEIVLNYLKELHEKDHKTIVMVTHESWALRDVQKVFFMEQGTIARKEIRTSSSLASLPSSQNISFSTRTPLSQLKEIYPELTDEQIRIKTLCLFLLHEYPVAQRDRLEIYLTKYMHKTISQERFRELLDSPFSQGGIGLWKNTVERILHTINEIKEEWEKVDAITALLEQRPSTSLQKDIAALTENILHTLHLSCTPSQYEKLNEIIEEKIRGVCSWEHIEKILSLSQKKNGIGFHGKTPRRIREFFQTVIG